MSIYGWKTEARSQEAREGLRRRTRSFWTTPRRTASRRSSSPRRLHLHAPVAIAAMKQGLHVITEKLMAQTVCQCKEMARVAKQDEAATWRSATSGTTTSCTGRPRTGSSAACWATSTPSAPSGTAATCRRRQRQLEDAAAAGHQAKTMQEPQEAGRVKLEAEIVKAARPWTQSTATRPNVLAQGAGPAEAQMADAAAGSTTTTGRHAGRDARLPGQRASKTPPARSSTNARPWRN